MSLKNQWEAGKASECTVSGCSAIQDCMFGMGEMGHSCSRDTVNLLFFILYCGRAGLLILCEGEVIRLVV